MSFPALELIAWPYHAGLRDVGTGWRALRETIPGFAALPEDRVVLAVRDLEPYQRERLDASALRTVPGAFDAASLDAALDAMTGAVTRVYLHVDLDALDDGVGRANPYAAPGGPSLAALLAGIDAVFRRFDVGAAALTAYDPRVDDDGAIAAAARQISADIARHVAHQRLTREAR